MSKLSNEAKGLLLAFEIGVEDGEPRCQRRKIEKYIAELEEELAARNATLDKVDEITKRLEIKIDNLQRNVDLAIEQKAQLEVENAELKQTLTLIGDIGYDYDGYGTPHDLKKLIDEMVGYARNPQTAVDALTAGEVKG